MIILFCFCKFLAVVKVKRLFFIAVCAVNVLTKPRNILNYHVVALVVDPSLHTDWFYTLTGSY